MRIATRIENGLILFQGEEDGSSWYSDTNYFAVGSEMFKSAGSITDKIKKSIFFSLSP